ncbi:hypothetical protein ACFL1H_03715 [Nanoarchaeota archaeon]
MKENLKIPGYNARRAISHVTPERIQRAVKVGDIGYISAIIEDGCIKSPETAKELLSLAVEQDMKFSLDDLIKYSTCIDKNDRVIDHRYAHGAKMFGKSRINVRVNWIEKQAKKFAVDLEQLNYENIKNNAYAALERLEKLDVSKPTPEYEIQDIMGIINPIQLTGDRACRLGRSLMFL